MRMLPFARRCMKEIMRDPVNLFFGLGFPLVLLVLLSAIQANVPVALFEIGHLTPGIAVFGLSFITLFSATVIAKDRGSALLPPADLCLSLWPPPAQESRNSWSTPASPASRSAA